ncbi:MAG TPA: helix-hairpin-helix domain-containing protein [Pirellulaceae bacterium]|nr:helix-hairpin-helix domain-containing protein [Pirellulaceae bacterium]
MISRITGKLKSLSDEIATLEIPPFEYQVLITEFTRRHLQAQIGDSVTLETIHYFEGNPQKGGKMLPRLIGFLSDVEREFFDQFCSVDGVGVKKALRAMVRPVQDIAKAIEQQDLKGVSTLPGIGPAMAERIVAKLRRKMGKFALLVLRGDTQDAVRTDGSLIDDTFQILLSFGHAESDARRLLETALQGSKKYKSVEELLQAVYDNSVVN